MTKAALTTLLGTKVRDTANAVWTTTEMSDAIDEALREVPNIVEDSSLTAVVSTQEYTIPSTIDVVKDVRIASGTIKVKIDPNSWEQVGTTLRFDVSPPLAGVITLKGTKLMTSTDDIPEPKVNFVLYSAVYKLWDLLAHKYASGFLKNDVTLSEIMAGMASAERKAEKARNQIPKVGYKL